MKRILLLFLLSTAAVASALAQRFAVTGTVVEAKTKKAVDFATVVLQRTDSTAVTSATTDENGFFTLQAKEAGKYSPTWASSRSSRRWS